MIEVDEPVEAGPGWILSTTVVVGWWAHRKCIPEGCGRQRTEQIHVASIARFRPMRYDSLAVPTTLWR
jgi:hypothetical protein